MKKSPVVLVGLVGVSTGMAFAGLVRKFGEALEKGGGYVERKCGLMIAKEFGTPQIGEKEKVKEKEVLKLKQLTKKN